MRLSSSIQLSLGRVESSSVNQGRLVLGNHIQCFCLSPPAPRPSDGTITPLWQQIQISPSIRLHPHALFSTCERTQPLHILPMTAVCVQNGGGMVWGKEEGDRQAALQCFPISSFWGSGGGAALKMLTSCGGVKPRECLLAPFCLSSLAQTGPEVLVCLKPRTFILLVTEKKS